MEPSSTQFDLRLLAERALNAVTPKRRRGLKRQQLRGHESFQFTLGWVYSQGTGVERDYAAKAVRYYSRAAASGMRNLSSNLVSCTDVVRVSSVILPKQ